MMYYIYGLREKGSKEYRYVGRTQHLSNRLYDHKTMTTQGNAYINPGLAAWIDSIGDGLQMDTLETVERFGRQYEQRWIDKLQPRGTAY